MAKLYGNVRPLASKQRIRLNADAGIASDENFTMANLFALVQSKYKDPVTPGKHFEFNFKIVGIELEVIRPLQDTNQARPAIVSVFGRDYEVRSNSRGLDAYVKPADTEWFGLWHNYSAIKALADKGATSGLNEIKIISDVHNTHANVSATVIVDVVISYEPDAI